MDKNTVILELVEDTIKKVCLQLSQIDKELMLPVDEDTLESMIAMEITDTIDRHLINNMTRSGK